MGNNNNNNKFLYAEDLLLCLNVSHEMKIEWQLQSLIYWNRNRLTFDNVDFCAKIYSRNTKGDAMFLFPHIVYLPSWPFWRVVTLFFEAFLLICVWNSSVSCQCDTCNRWRAITNWSPTPFYFLLSLHFLWKNVSVNESFNISLPTYIFSSHELQIQLSQTILPFPRWLIITRVNLNFG